MYGKEGWFPMAFVELTASDTPSMRQKNMASHVRIDDSSIFENKSEIMSDLDNRLHDRPERRTLRDTNILPTVDSDPSLVAAQKKLEKSKKVDFLTSFLRKRREKEHVLKPPLKIYKKELTFDNKICDVNDVIEETFEIKNREFSRMKWKIDCNVYNQPFTVTFEPSSGKLIPKKKEVIKVRVVIKNIASKDIPVHFMCGTEQVGEITLRIRCVDSFFGVDPLTLEMQRDEDGLVVPKVLVTLQNSLKKHDAFSKEGIFRLAGEATNISFIRKKIDKKDFTDDSDVFSVATLVKVWYRELPTPVLSQVSKQQLMLDDPLECFKVIDSIDEPEHSLMHWLIKLLHSCSMQCSINKMPAEKFSYLSCT